MVIQPGANWKKNNEEKLGQLRSAVEICANINTKP